MEYHGTSHNQSSLTHHHRSSLTHICQSLPVIARHHSPIFTSHCWSLSVITSHHTDRVSPLIHELYLASSAGFHLFVSKLFALGGFPWNNASCRSPPTFPSSIDIVGSRSSSAYTITIFSWLPTMGNQIEGQRDKYGHMAKVREMNNALEHEKPVSNSHYPAVVVRPMRKRKAIEYDENTISSVSR